MTTQSAIPLKWYVPFATGDASRVEIPVTSSDATRASQTLGFPPLTMQPPEAGGVPPQGEDFNGALNQVARIAWWTLNGGGWPFDASFAGNSNINGYPNGAKLQSADFAGDWLNTVDNNQNNPDTNGTGWVPGYQYGATAVTGLTGGTTTLSPLQAAKKFITLSGALTSPQTIVLPAWVREWTVTNNTTGAFALTVKTAAGSGIAVPQNGTATPITGDGTNIIQSPQNIAAATQLTQAMQLGQASGRLLRSTKYYLISGIQNVAVNGGTPTTTGSSVFNPQALTSIVKIKVQGGGGGAPGTPSTSSNVAAAPGGAGGAYGEGFFTAASAAGAAVAVGAGGAGGVAGLNAGVAGNSSSVGALINAPGGGAPSPTPAGGAPLIAGGTLITGAPSGANFLARAGGPGGFGIVQAQGASGVGGYGGPAGDGGAGPSGGTNAAGASALNAGAGGAGGSQSATTGGAFGGGKGGDGYVIIEEYA